MQIGNLSQYLLTVDCDEFSISELDEALDHFGLDPNDYRTQEERFQAIKDRVFR